MPEHKQALFDAAVEVMRKQSADRAAEKAAEAARERDRHRVSPIIAGGLTILLGVGVYIAVEQPTWLLPTPPRVESTAAQEASLRIGMATTLQRIERFRIAQGRLPRSIAEAGATPPGIVYEQHEGDRYTLHGENGSVRLTLNSGDSLPRFVGNSFHVLAERSHR
ncbi:MAG TPA: hypothetical protein VK688_12625 [Gemmatimonadales bacterium]|jgi:hypothetical protein|nr:hypothetical protein [Gemmatimonadales bacterium]